MPHRIKMTNTFHSTPKASTRAKGQKSKNLSLRRSEDFSNEKDYNSVNCHGCHGVESSWIACSNSLREWPQPSDSNNTLDITKLPSQVKSQMILKSYVRTDLKETSKQCYGPSSHQLSQGYLMHEHGTGNLNGNGELTAIVSIVTLPSNHPP